MVIPARIGSTRLPRKVLLEINGKPMLHHVIERCLETELVEEVFVVTDSQEVYDSVSLISAKALMSDPDCSSGTARIASVIDQLPGEIIVNVQADQPVVEPALIGNIIQELADSDADISTPVWLIKTIDQLKDPALVKVVFGHQGEALYFSRNPIPFVRDRDISEWMAHAQFFGHHGVYGYRRSILENFPLIPSGKLENLEKLEQLRFLEAGYRIQTVLTEHEHLSIDNPEDLDSVSLQIQSI